MADNIDELLDCNEKYDELFEFCPDAVIIHHNYTVIYANEAAAELLETDKAENLIGKNILKAIHPEYHEVVRKRVEKTYNKECKVPRLEEKFITYKGNIVDVEVTGTPFSYKDKICTIVFVTDITERKRMEKELRDRETLLSQITENTFDMISKIDLNYRNCYVTKSHEAILGYAEEELIGISPLILIHPEDVEMVQNEFEKIAKNSCKAKFQYRIRHADGHYIHVESIGKELTNINGEKEGYIFSTRDISSRVYTEERLKKSRQKFKVLFNHLNDAVILQKYSSESKKFSFVEVNDAACRRYEFTRKELLQKTIFDIVCNDYEELSNVYDKLLEKGSVIHYFKEISKSGMIIPVEVNSVMFDLEDEKYLLSISRDMRERIEVEGKLIESELQYRTLIENFPYGIFIRNKNELLFANKKGMDDLGMSLSDAMLNTDFLDQFKVHPTYRKVFINKMKFLKKNGYMPLAELKFLKQNDSTELDLEVCVTKIAFENEEANLIITRDVSEKKKAEELKKNIEEKTKLLNEVVEYEKLRTEFFANISHELRTPINIILSTLQLFGLNLNMLDKDVNSDKTKKYIAIMKQNCYRLIRLINNLIDATRIDSGYFEVELTTNNIVSVVEDITLSIAEYIENKGISVIFDTDIEEKMIACDPDKIERIILNLISNAVKFTEVGGEILVNIKEKEDTVEISVKDTGIGIPRNKQENIFRRFVQVDKSLTRNREGSGIGLSLVKSLVELHNGTIRLESEQGKGSEFIIELPSSIAEEKESISNSVYNIQGNIEKISVEFSDIYF